MGDGDGVLWERISWKQCKAWRERKRGDGSCEGERNEDEEGVEA